MTQKIEGPKLQSMLEALSAQGISVDRQKLKRDMCAQFADHRLYIREYVVNAFDAGAKHCWISGADGGETLTIVVEDDGRGMDRKGVLDFVTLFRSVKQANPDAIGTHGIGKLSVAAIPGQSGFTMITSTGRESWRMEAGCLLDDAPIRVEGVEPVRERGTRFEITFKKSCPLKEEMRLLASILERWVRYLPIVVVIFELREDSKDTLGEARWVHGIQGAWNHVTERFQRMYQFTWDGQNYDVVLGMDQGAHEIYQGRVFVSDQYNLLSFGRQTLINIPYLKIRIDSRAFELPFGRHRLRNEDVLVPVSHHLRERILPQYLSELFRAYEEGGLSQFEITPMEVEEMACALMAFDRAPERPWSRLPVFKTLNRQRQSLEELLDIAVHQRVLYLEGERSEGQDVSAFETTVLSNHQPRGGLEVLKAVFRERLLDLSGEDVALEAPLGKAPSLGDDERRFQAFLGFHPQATSMKGLLHLAKPEARAKAPASVLMRGLLEGDERAKTIIGHSQEVGALKWRVNYLVQKDGSTPSRTRRFLLSGKEVVLNLYHDEVRQLLRLSEFAPSLAGHWALCMCLTDENRFMRHLSAETREELILLDAMARSGSDDMTAPQTAAPTPEDRKRAFREFMRNVEQFDPES
jgi:hypothetical protein